MEFNEDFELEHEVEGKQHSDGVAIIGMAGRFPGARDIEALWENLCDGVESITTFSDQEVADAGVDPRLAQDPHYVKAGGFLEGEDLFDAGFFGIYPKEAAILDPQQRLFLECAWEALEHAGYDPETYPGWIGMFAGTGMNMYMLYNLIQNREVMETVHGYQLTISSDKDFLPTRVSYKLNLHGPSINVQTACSTSLVAIHLACQSLLNYQCEMALAGGVAIKVPQKQGYLYQEGGIASPDGHCRAFDADAAGTVSGNGLGIVVLKRLEAALADQDTIYAVIKGSAINNDGSAKVGYTAPSVEGQMQVISTALAVADVDPATISYIEAHGTGTSMGDPIEITALSQVYQEHTDKLQYCAVGSVKANIGHLDAAAGVTGVIKTALALRNKVIPPSINYSAPNPQIDFANSPFFVNDRLRAWESDGLPRRAAVSSFGIGGTNAHAILEEAPEAEPETTRGRDWQLWLVSARSENARQAAADRLAQYLRAHPEISLPDAAYTLQVGRRAFSHRQVVVANSRDDLLAVLEGGAPQRVLRAAHHDGDRSLVFMFTGQGSQYVNMGRELYESEPVFREQVDDCARLLKRHLGVDLRDVLYPAGGDLEQANDTLRQTKYTQPALFVIEYALAQLLHSWGLKPAAMIGHSIGEYVAACLAGVFTLQDALSLVAARGRLMQSVAAGAMVSVSLSEDEVLAYLQDGLSLAAINAPGLCVVSGTFEAVDALVQRLAHEGVEYRRLVTSHAFHSAMMEPILEQFTSLVRGLPAQAPELPFISNLTGTWITPEQAQDPTYWASHLRHGVRFADGMGELLKDPGRIFLEVGPGRTLTMLAKGHPQAGPERAILPTIHHPQDVQPDVAFLLTTLGRLWMAGANPDWEQFYAGEVHRRVGLPTYPFERQRYWVEGEGTLQLMRERESEPRKKPQVQDWFYTPSWKRSVLPVRPANPGRWLVFQDENGLGEALERRLTGQGHEVILVHPGEAYHQNRSYEYVLDPGDPGGYHNLVRALQNSGGVPDQIVHLWSLNPLPGLVDEAARFAAAQARGYYSLLFLARALSKANVNQALRIHVVTSGGHEVSGGEALLPENAPILGLCSVLAQEFPQVICQSIDLSELEPKNGRANVEHLLAEVSAPALEPQVAFRLNHRWVRVYEPLEVEQMQPGQVPGGLKQNGVYLITGGLGRIGLALAGYLARLVQARLVLVDRYTLPPRESWPALSAAYPTEEPLADKVRQVLALEALGAEVLLSAADITQAGALRQVIDETTTRWGRLDGVIHAAGLVGDAAIRSIQETGPRESEAQFQAKVYGLQALCQALAGRELDFVILQSSLSTVLGGLGMAAYAAANRYMDTFALQQARSQPAAWISVNWDGWNFGDGGGTGQAELSLTLDEGLQAFANLLDHPTSGQVVISTGDLNARLEKWVRRVHAVEEDKAQPGKSGSLRQPRPNLATAFVPPHSETERAIAEMWQKVLGIDEIGVLDDFFELGGHSLLATQLVTRVRDQFKVDLPLRRLFESPTIGGLAELVEAARPAEAPIASPAGETIGLVDRSGPLPLSFGQQRLWFLDQLEPGSPLYNNFAAIRLEGDLDVEALKACIVQICRRHEALRTTFQELNGQPVQVIAPEIDLPIRELDLQALPGADNDAEVRRLALIEANQPFDLQHGPLLRVCLLRLAPHETILFLTMHHIVSDGWSVGVLVAEVGALYSAYLQGQADPLPPLAVQYADYAAWQSAWMQGERRTEHLAYWQEQLAGSPGVLDLETDLPRPAVQTSNGASEWFEISPEISSRLASFSQKEGVTLFMTLLASLDALFYRYTGQADFNIGTPIANRSRMETESLIGFFLNTLVLRATLEENPSFTGLLQQVRETALGAYAHQDLPFEMLVEELQPQRDMSRSPFFQVIFDLQVAALPDLNLPGLSVSPLRLDAGTTKFDLAFSVEETRDGLRGYLNYNTDLFRVETIRRMIEHWKNLLESAAANPQQRISELAMLDAAEIEILTGELSGRGQDYLETPGLLQMIAAQAEASPHAAAVQMGDRQLDYAAFTGRAIALANHLRRLGVQPDEAVGLCLPRSIDAMVGLLAILQAGGVYLPLDPAAPRERLAYQLEDSGVRVVLSQESLVDALHSAGAPGILEIVCLDRLPDSALPGSNEQTGSLPQPSDRAYIIYTSGSTGKPKGVEVTHQAIAAHCLEIQEHFRISAQDRVLQFSAYSFDQSIEQILVTWISGAALVLRGDELWEPAGFSRVINDYGLTVVNIQPAYWRQWARHLASEMARQGAAAGAPTLKLVIIGGDAILPENVRLWQETSLNGVRLLNAYGPTEAVITASTYEIEANQAVSGRVPIGRPVGARRFYVLDAHGGLLPFGAAGELFIGGDRLARGYLNQDGLTSERFVPDPFSPTGGRMYRTGDRVRWLADGSLEFLGRVDFQVKVRGFRIELGEIEAVLEKHPAVKAQVVLAREDTGGEKRLVAYIVADPQANLGAAGLAEFLKEKLPAYMHPSAYVFLDELPLSASGKVNRRALPEPDASRPELGRSFQAPRNAMEENLAEIWRELLGVEQVGIDDTFFELGGHSLLATQMVARVRDRYHVELPLRRLFETPTIAGLAGVIQEGSLSVENDAELDDLLAELDGLTDEEARKLLEQEGLD